MGVDSDRPTGRSWHCTIQKRSSPGSEWAARSALASPIWPANGIRRSSSTCSKPWPVTPTPSSRVRCRSSGVGTTHDSPHSEDNDRPGIGAKHCSPLRPFERIVRDISGPIDEATRPLSSPTNTRTLAQAQAHKIERLLDATGVRRGTRLLEIGTGWGELALRAARRGAHVTSLTLSNEQAALARQRVAAEGLATCGRYPGAGLSRCHRHLRRHHQCRNDRGSRGAVVARPISARWTSVWHQAAGSAFRPSPWPMIDSWPPSHRGRGSTSTSSLAA